MFTKNRYSGVSPLLTDLYQLTMLEAYLAQDMNEKAVFEFFVRALPKKRGFLVAAGLDSVLGFLNAIKFSEEEIDYLAKTKRFTKKLLNYLSTFRFYGDVYAIPEGTIFYENEPVIRIEAPIPMAQFVETRLINLINFETLIATKAARCFLAAREKAVLVDFGLRRAHGAEAGLLAARSSYIAGFVGTATVLANAVFGIPIFGTMAHSYVESCHEETEAFVAFARANPNNVTLLVDTYDTQKGVSRAIDAAKLLSAEGIKVRAIRIDSGDIAYLTKNARSMLDMGGFKEMQIFVSGNIDEYEIERLLLQGAPINGFGIGTKLDTSEDAPYLECAYKLMEYAGTPRIKLSTGKATFPCRKQVYRRYEDGKMVEDTVVPEGFETTGKPLLKKVMEKGQRIVPERTLEEIATFAKTGLKALPEYLCNLTHSISYPVVISPELIALKDKTERQLRERGTF